MNIISIIIHGEMYIMIIKINYDEIGHQLFQLFHTEK